MAESAAWGSRRSQPSARLRLQRADRSAYAVLAAAARAIPADGSPESVLPALLDNLARGTGARRAAIWARVDGGALVAVAAWPPLPEPSGSPPAHPPPTVADLTGLREAPGVDGVAPIVDGEVERGAVTIAKSGPGSVTAADQALLLDTAACSAVAIRATQLEAELRQRLRRAEELGAELAASRERLAYAGDVERRRITSEILAMTNRLLAGIGDELRQLSDGLVAGTPTSADVSALQTSLDELIEQFRTLVRGVYPAALSDRGPRAALDELAVELPRPVLISGEPRFRLAWELEAGLYFAAAAAMQALAGSLLTQPLRVRVEHAEGRIAVHIDDIAAMSPAQLQFALAGEADRLAALGGGVEWSVASHGTGVIAWVPDQLAPPLDRPVSPPPTGDSAGPITAPAPPIVRAGRFTPSEPGSLTTRVRALTRAASAAYQNTAGGDDLRAAAARLDEPVRVALVGRTGVGKSTLLNALIERELATTGPAGADLVTWYRAGASRQVTAHPWQGPLRPLATGPTEMAKRLADEGLTYADVERVEVEWPAPALHEITLVDTPGIDSASAERTEELLFPAAQGPPAVDAIIYVIRWLDDYDARFLAALRDTGNRQRPPIVLGVLSHVDQAGAEPAAGRRRDPAAGRRWPALVPVDGLLAAGGATLRDAEYRALRVLAAEPASRLAELLSGSYSFAQAADFADLSPQERAALLRRFGLSGVRAAVRQIQTGSVNAAAELSAGLVQASGLPALRSLLAAHAVARADVLRARSAVQAVGAVLRRWPRPGPHPDPLVYELQEINTGAHELVELDLLASLQSDRLALPADDRAAAERLLGSDGTEPHARLGLPPAADADDIRRAAQAQIVRWQHLAEHPATTIDVRHACRVMLRTAEGLLAAADGGALVPARGPADASAGRFAPSSPLTME